MGKYAHAFSWALVRNLRFLLVNENTVTCMGGFRRVFGLNIGFIEHLHVVTTNSYDCIAYFHTLPITPVHAKFSVCFH
jgi:hypothetical protein